MPSKWDWSRGDAALKLPKASCSEYLPPFPEKMSLRQTKKDKANLARAFIRTLKANVDNQKLTDAEFRSFVRNTLGIFEEG